MDPTTVLANLTISDLNYTANCNAILPLGMQIYQNEFSSKVPGMNWHTLWTESQQKAFEHWRPGERSREWIDFWNASLATSFPADIPFPNTSAVAQWANTSDAFFFFALVPEIVSLGYISRGIDTWNGCDEKFVTENSENSSSANASWIGNLASLEAGCITEFCCPNRIETTPDQQRQHFPYYTKWTVEEACSFKTCANANHGNPDLGGIGVSVSVRAILVDLSLTHSFHRFLSHIILRLRFLLSAC